MKSIQYFVLAGFLGLIFATVSITQAAISVSPSTAQQAEQLAVVITGNNTHFTQEASSTVWLSRPGSPNIYSNGFYSVDNTTLIAQFFIPFGTTTGQWDTNVSTSTDGTVTNPGSFTVTPYNPILTTITPGAAYQGQRLAVAITGQNSHFLFQQGSPVVNFGQGSPTLWFGGPSQSQQGSPTNGIFWLSQGSSTIVSNDGGVAGNELLMADISIPQDANAGLWNVNVPTPTAVDGLMILPNAFRITRPGDITGDEDCPNLDCQNPWRKDFEKLAQDVTDLGLQYGIENSLLAKLDAAIQKLDDDNDNNNLAAINSLQAFINAVEAQRGKKISVEDADYLINAAQQIIDLLSSE